MANTNNLSFGLKLADGQVLVLGGSQFVSNKSGQERTLYTVTVYDGYNCKKCFVREPVYLEARDNGTGLYTAVFDLNGNLRKLILDVALDFQI